MSNYSFGDIVWDYLNFTDTWFHPSIDYNPTYPVDFSK